VNRVWEVKVKKAEVIKYFKSLYPAENDGGGVWLFTLKDDEVGYSRMSPQLTNLTGQQKIGISLVMNPRFFCDLKTEIYQNNGGSLLFTIGNGNIFIKAGGEITEVHLDEITKIAFDWIDKCSMEEVIAAELKHKYEIYNRPGGWQFTHIIACVLKGDVERLQSYLNAFKRGDRMEFIPIIKQEYFERAIPLAEKYRSGERVSPVAF
jgi:hypothetical protein